MKTPLALVSGPLGSGKTTLLRGLIHRAEGRISVIAALEKCVV